MSYFLEREVLPDRRDVERLLVDDPAGESFLFLFFSQLRE